MTRCSRPFENVVDAFWSTISKPLIPNGEKSRPKPLLEPRQITISPPISRDGSRHDGTLSFATAKPWEPSAPVE
jgi:hypothetical protein